MKPAEIAEMDAGIALAMRCHAGIMSNMGDEACRQAFRTESGQLVCPIKDATRETTVAAQPTIADDSGSTRTSTTPSYLAEIGFGTNDHRA